MSTKVTSLITLQEIFEKRLEGDLVRLPTMLNSDPDEHLVRSLISEVEQEFAFSRERNDKIVLSTGAESKKYQDDHTFEGIRTSYHTLWAKLVSYLPRPNTPEDTMNVSTNQSNLYVQSQLKLNKVSLPTFSGKYDDWMNFNNMFTAAVHNNVQMDPIVKLEYLKRALTGEAELLIKNMELNAANYTLARARLSDRYQHTRRLVNAYLKKLYDLPSIKIESIKSLKEMLNTLDDCRSALKQLKVEIEDYRLIYHLCRKLPTSFLTAWEESLKASTDLPNYDKFQTFLETRFRILEMTEPTEKATKSFHVNSVPKPKSKSKPEKRSFTKPAPIKTCVLCKSNHILGKCEEFLKLSQSDKLQTVKANKSCINCLDSSHTLQTCWSTKTCRVCQQKHHTLLHRYETDNNTQNPPASSTSSPAHRPIRGNFHINSHEETCTLLGTAQLRAVNPCGYSIIIRALIDPCSEDSYILASTVQTLQLKKYYAPSTIGVLGEEKSAECTHRVDLILKSMDDNFDTTISAGIVDKITSQLPSVQLSTDIFKNFKKLSLADTTFNEPGCIHMLLGVDIHTKIRMDQSYRLGPDLIAESSRLGYIVRGKAPTQASNSTNVFMTKSSSTQLSAQIQKFWEIEEVNNESPSHPDDTLCETIFRNTIHRDSDGFLSMSLPFKDNICPNIGPSRQMAVKRFLSIEKKLKVNSELRNEYHKTIQNYLHSDFLREAPNIDTYSLQQYYLPHHAVVKECSSTTKVRVVFDASCKSFDGTSLNDHLLTGKKLQKDIRDVLFNWRQYPFSLTSDVEKMYLMFKITPDHHNYQRIVWRFSENEPIQDYILTRNTFGTSCAPFLAMRSLHHIADLHEQSHPTVSYVLRNEFYVDDFLSGGFSIEEASEKQTVLRTVLQDYHLTLRKWSSNHPQTLINIPNDLLDSSNELVFDETEFKKTLGIFWSREKDAFFFSIAPIQELNFQFTKRQILSLIARLYDPLGWVSPCTLLAKHLMQKIWQTKTGWDDLVEESISSQFKIFVSELPLLKKFSIPRWTNVMDPTSPLTIFGFSDASDKGYAAVVYLLNPKSQDKKLTLLTSKTKVADLKFQSTARLELNGALLLSELLKWTVSMYIPRKVEVVAFCDSKIVLAWLQGHPSRWKTYVANRTTQILEWMQPSQWHYIDTKMNPADCASRGLLPSEIITHDLWLHGPNVELLHYEHDENLTEEQQHILEDSIKRTSLVLHTKQNMKIDLLSKFSNHSKHIRVATPIANFVKGIVHSILEKLKDPKTEHEHERHEKFEKLFLYFENPEYVIFRAIQIECYRTEFKALLNKTDLHKDSKIRGLNPFIDGYGLLRVGGRLGNSDLSFDQQHPIILPNKHQVVLNVIRDAHEKTIHGTELLTLAYLRHRFHIPRASEKVRNLIHSCMICFRFAKQQQEFLMGTLPKDRVNLARAFQHSGVDYAGPITVKAYKGRCKKFSKSYVALFICLCTKAIHLEIVSDLSSQSFLAAFKRFVGRRGRCQRLYSDNGTNFVGADRILQNDILLAEQTWKSDLDLSFKDSGTEWHFIPPATPHFGGLWEAGVKSIKSHLKKTIGDSILTYEELSTILIQIEAVLNSRPLCPISNNPNEFNVLTPGHFLIGEPLVAPPERNFELDRKSHIERWNHVQLTYQRFAKLWKRDYLNNLQNRPKGFKTSIHYKEGDLVLLAEDDVPPTTWPTMIVDKTHPGTDMVVRVVTLRSSTGKVLKRPVTKLRRLPCNSSSHQ